jgi:hypothetical protein
MLLTEFHGSETVELAASASEVFELLIDIDRLPDWNARIDHVIEPAGCPLTSGVEWVIQMRAMGTRWPSRARTLTVDRAAGVFEHRSCTDDGNPSYALWSWNVVPHQPGSTFTVTWAVHPETFWRRLLLARARRPVLANEVKASLAGLDRYLRSRNSIAVGQSAPTDVA